MVSTLKTSSDETANVSETTIPEDVDSKKEQVEGPVTIPDPEVDQKDENEFPQAAHDEIEAMEPGDSEAEKTEEKQEEPNEPVTEEGSGEKARGDQLLRRAAADANLISGEITTEKALIRYKMVEAIFQANCLARKDEDLPKDTFEKVIDMVVEAACNLWPIWDPFVMMFLDSQIKKEGVKARVANLEGFEVVECNCDDDDPLCVGYQVINKKYMEEQKERQMTEMMEEALGGMKSIQEMLENLLHSRTSREMPHGIVIVNGVPVGII